MFNFGAAASKPAAASSFTFGGNTSTPATTTAAAGGFSLSTNTTSTTATTSTPSLFGNTNTLSTNSSLIPSQPTSFTSNISTVPTTQAALTQPTTVKPGLGGTGYTNQTEANNSNAAAPVPVKQQMLPKDVNNLVTQLENHIKKEKEESSEVAKYSQRQLNKIKENANSLELLIKSLKSNVQRENATVDKMCQNANHLQTNVEMAQRTHDTHAALQHENFMPSRYFAELIIEFEQKLTIYRSQIDQLESHLAANSEIALSELPQTLERLHQTFIALAAGLQIILSHMDKLKQRYLNYRRQVLGDTTDVFQKKVAKKEAVIKGPSPFAELSNLSVLAMAQLQAQQQATQPPNTGFSNTNNTGGGIFGNNKPAGNTFGTSTSAFGTGNTGGGLFGNTSTAGGLGTGTTSTFGQSTTGGLFGNTANNQAKSTFSFGGTTSTPAPATGGLFGNTTTPAPSLFGNTASNTANTGFSFGKK